MKFYLQDDVLTAAKKRIRWLFNEFEGRLVVDFSGGKDSTVVLNLTLQVAEEMGLPPVKVFFLDQEAEWNAVIEYMRIVMSDPRVDPLWHQIPMKINNATSVDDPWLYCWREGDEWLRPKEPNSIHDNPYGTDRFAAMFGAHSKYLWPDQTCVRVAGVRASESPARRNGLTAYETYKGETWGKIRDRKVGHYDMYPLYDWADSDIWKAIHSHGWPYCTIYDDMYRYGVPINGMRVSNLHHETAVHTLFYLQEIEHDTWEKLTARLKGINTAGQLKKDIIDVSTLPPMFESWKEYRDFLLPRLIKDPEHVEYFKRKFAQQDDQYVPEIDDKLHKMHVSSILVNDFQGIKMSTFSAVHGAYSKNRGKLSGYKGGSRAAS